MTFMSCLDYIVMSERIAHFSINFLIDRRGSVWYCWFWTKIHSVVWFSR